MSILHSTVAFLSYISSDRISWSRLQGNFTNGGIVCRLFMSSVAPELLDRVLTPDDAVEVLDEILPAQTQSFQLGLKLMLPYYQVESIHKIYSDPEMCLLHILIAFMKQVEPRPTRRIIIHALRSRSINLPQIAASIEATHGFSAGSSISSLVTPCVIPSTRPTPTESLELLTADTGSQALRLESPEPDQVTVVYVKAKIQIFEKRFNELKKATRIALEKRKISVKKIVDVFTSMPADEIEEHKQFLSEHLKEMYDCSDVSELIGRLSVDYWDYLSYQLLEYLVKEFKLEIEKEMEAYKLDLQRFRQKTPLALYCQSQKRRRRRPSEEFQELVAEFPWPVDVMLETVEQFRQEYAYHYKLRECAMMLAEVRPCSFVIAWFIPSSIVQKLSRNIPIHILKAYSALYLEEQKSDEILDLEPGSPGSPGFTTKSFSDVPASRPEKSSLSPYEDYPFVEKPSEDYFCPVTLGLLLQPHLTSCCGKHLSQESASRIQEEGGACPLCKDPNWSTVLDKFFQREVLKLSVYCSYKVIGCWWSGELSELQPHLQSCQLRLIRDNNQGRTELHDAAERGEFNRVQELLCLESLNINSRTDDEGDTALLLASMNGHVEVVGQLLEAKALVDIPDKNCSTPLLWASYCGYAMVSRLLLDSGASVTISDENGITPIYIASQEGHVEVVDILVKKEANVNQATSDTSVPLGVASERGHINTVLRLIEAGANPNYQNKDGLSPLCMASQKGQSEVISVLLNSGASVNQPLNALAIASKHGFIKTTKTLLEAGATVSLHNMLGNTALRIAKDRKNGSIVKYLQKKDKGWGLRKTLRRKAT